MYVKKLWKWLIPLFFLLLGIFCFCAVHGHDFLGIVSCGIAGVICCYYLISLLRKERIFAAKILNTVLTFLLCLGLCAFVITEAFIVQASRGEKDPQFTYLVVLGAKVNGTSPSLSLNDRLQSAYEYMTAHPNVIAVLSGGQGADEGISEAQCMYNELTKRGIRADRLWLEDQATSTWENLQFSLRIIEEKTGTRPQTIGLLSSEYHLYRAGLFADACGIDAALIPADTSWPTIRLNYFMREVPAVWKFIIFGG